MNYVDVQLLLLFIHDVSGLVLAPSSGEWQWWGYMSIYTVCTRSQRVDTMFEVRQYRDNVYTLDQWGDYNEIGIE